MKKQTRAYHSKYGFGYIISDDEGFCKPNELMFKPDNGIFDRLEPSNSTYAFSDIAKYDIVLESELEIFK